MESEVGRYFREDNSRCLSALSMAKVRQHAFWCRGHQHKKVLLRYSQERKMALVVGDRSRWRMFSQHPFGRHRYQHKQVTPKCVQPGRL